MADASASLLVKCLDERWTDHEWQLFKVQTRVMGMMARMYAPGR
jgi:hypothetical protein